MGKLLKRIGWFGLPFVGLLAWLLWDMPDRAYAYNMVQKDCRTGNWMHRRLYATAAPVDVAFIGTSKTMCDVNDSLLEHRLWTEHGKQVHVANFGVCRLGENLHWLIARDIFERKRPRHLIVEVSTDMAPNSHFHFPYLAGTGDVVGAPLWGNLDYWADLSQLCWNRLVYHRERILGIERKFDDFLVDSLHSFMRVKDDLVADPSEMAAIKARREKTLRQELPTGVGRWLHDWRVHAPRQYFRMLAALCKQHHARLVFLYLPAYGAPARPQEAHFLESLGEIWLPPDSVFGDPSLHFDHSHLNLKGAGKLSDWLVRKLVELDQGDAEAPIGTH